MKKINEKHQNQIRITGGQLRGRKIQFPSADGLRPTPDSVRERLFNWLGQDLTGQIVLDLFAGSGALGFESASRHAKQVEMCEIHKAAAQNLSIEKAVFPWAASGRALANGCDYGFTKLIIDKNTHRVVGGALVGPNAGDMISEIALAIEMDATVQDIALTIHPHPTLGESIGMAAEVAEGSCTDLPPQKKLF